MHSCYSDHLAYTRLLSVSLEEAALSWSPDIWSEVSLFCHCMLCNVSVPFATGDRTTSAFESRAAREEINPTPNPVDRARFSSKFCTSGSLTDVNFPIRVGSKKQNLLKFDLTGFWGVLSLCLVPGCEVYRGSSPEEERDVRWGRRTGPPAGPHKTGQRLCPYVIVSCYAEAVSTGAKCLPGSDIRKVWGKSGRRWGSYRLWPIYAKEWN